MRRNSGDFHRASIWLGWLACWLGPTCQITPLGFLDRSLVAQEADLVSELTDRGLRFTSDRLVKLKPVTLQAGMSRAERTEAVEKLAGKQEWSRFARNSVMAPVAINIDTIDDASGERLGLWVHNAFIVYTSFDKLRDRDLMEETFGRPGGAEDAAGVVTRELPSDELRRLGFEEQAASSASFAYLELPLLNKVLIRGVIRIEKRESPERVEFVWRLDPSFDRVPQYASRWTKLERNAVGKLFEGESHPYTGCAGIIGGYEVDAAAQQLLVESQLLLREPTEWFAGSNFLRSKLPLSMQENARNFRRQLAKAN